MADAVKGFARRRQPSVKEVMAQADLMDQRRQEQIREQKETITSMLSYLEHTDQVADYLRWKVRKEEEAGS